MRLRDLIDGAYAAGAARFSTTPSTDFTTAPDWFHEGQLAAWNSDAEEIVVLAGTQSGKTAMQAPWLLREIQLSADVIRKLKHGDFLYIGPTLRLLEAQAMPTFERLFVEEHNLGRLVRGSKPKFHFSPEGAQKVLGFEAPITVHFAYANDSSNLESLTALGAVWDECGQKENRLASYFACSRRLQVGRAHGRGRRLWGTTPYEWNWFKSQVYDRAREGALGFSLHSFVSWMNPNVSEDSCRAELERGMPQWRWEMMYLGRFRKPAGVVFDCFERDRHTCAPFEIPSSWKRFSGHDFGPINSAAVFAAQDPQTGVVYVHATYHPGEARTTTEHASEMLRKQGLRKAPAAWGGASSEDRWRTDFGNVGYPIDPPPVADLFDGIHRLYSLLKRGLLVVFSDLTRLIEDLESYSYELTDEGEPIPRKIQDKESYHRLDALRYLASALYEGLGEAEERSPESRWERELQLRPRHRGPGLEERRRAALH